MNDPLQIIYSWAFRLNQRRRERTSQGFDLRVISVGGLTAGGSGKTPAVLMIAGILEQEGYHPIVVTRGYRGEAEREGRVLRPGSRQPDPGIVGDEPAMIAEALPGGHVIVGRNRRENLARFLLENPELHDTGVVLLDDGFQHRQIRRDCDLLLLDEETLSRGRLLPWGRLREPLERARRADVILLRVDETQSQAAADEVLRRRLSDLPGTIIPVRDVIDTPRHVRLGTGIRPGTRTLLVTGVARPDRIRAMLRRTGLEVVDALRFDDHHSYRRQDVTKMLAKMTASGAGAIVTTGKDSVKLRRFAALDPVLHTIPHRLVPVDPEGLRRILRERCLKSAGVQNE